MPYFMVSQIDKLKGKVKSTSEKIIFVNDSIQNYKLFSFDGDYGHGGFISPKSTIRRFNHNWYNDAIADYINNRRNYNQKGLLISEDWFDKKNKKIASYEYQYTTFDSLSRIRKFNRFDDDRITNISYNYSNNVQSALDYRSNSSENFSLLLYQYENSIKVKEKFLNQEGISREKLYSYNKDGLLHKIIEHKPTIWAKLDSESYYEKKDSIGTYYCSRIKFYNDKKLLIEENTFSQPEYNSESQLRNKVLYVYDERGNCIEERRSSAHSELVSIYKKIFDGKNRVIEESHIAWNENDSSYKKEFIYNEKGELIRLNFDYNGNVKHVDFKYKYDSYDNWVKQTKYVDNKKMFVLRRQIEYYD